jgi:23S rRNA (cytosine1962-C5)-methyltransferase
VHPGEVVDVHGPEGAWIARAYCNPRAEFPLRLLRWTPGDVGPQFYGTRVRAAYQRRLDMDLGAEAWRWIHAEADGLPGLIVDRFGSALAVQFRNAGVERHRGWILEALREVSGAELAFERSETHERRAEGLSPQSGLLWGALPERVIFSEDGILHRFAPLISQKTGFFLDQRDNRRWLSAQFRPGQALLDLYCYTGAFSLRAARAGLTAYAVDRDPLALTTLEESAAHNGLGSQIALRLGDVPQVLAELRRSGRTFEHIVFDPPTLVKQKSEVPWAKRLIAGALADALAMLRPAGLLLVSSCAHHLRLEDLLEAARWAAGDAGALLEVVRVSYQPPDHPWMLQVPESLYLKSVALRRLE